MAKPTEPRSRERSPGETDEHFADVMDFPELTDDQIAASRPFAEVFPDLAARLRPPRGAQKAPTLTPVKLRLDQPVIDHFKAGGRGWQSRMRAVLRKAAGL